MTKKAKAEATERTAFTERVLMALANDIVALQEASEAVATKIRALAIAHRIKVPEAA
jgi:hypothetical protein